MKHCQFCAEEIQDAAIVCRFCGRDQRPEPKADDPARHVGASPEGVPPTRKSGLSPGAKVFVGLGFAVVASALLVFVGLMIPVAERPKEVGTPPAQESVPASRPPAAPRDDLELFLQRFGAPDTDTSAADEVPRPPFVTRILTYTNEKVRVVYRADVAMGAPPPYDGKWKLLGFTDPTSDKALRPAEALKRLAKRDRGR